MAGKLTIKLIKSVVGSTADQRATIRSLGLHRINGEVAVADSAVTRGMIRKVRHLVRVQDSEERNETS
jgi:large subunit ribosomal protein L30